MARCGLLIVTNLSKIAKSLTAVNKYVSNTLYVQLYTGESHFPAAAPASFFRKHVARIYTASLEKCQQLNVIVIVENLKIGLPLTQKPLSRPIEVLLFDRRFSRDVTEELMEKYNTKNVIEFDAASESESETDAEWEGGELVDQGDDVALGGTFDNLHWGHKVLLTEGVLLARKRLIVGVTDFNMIKNKTLHELILPVEQRIATVRQFLGDIDPTLIYEVVPIQDAFGPTKTDPKIDIIVVSTETLRGGQKVNEIRAEAKLNQLHIHPIDLIEFDTKEEAKEVKISSSNIRLDLLGKRLREPKVNPDLPSRPYLIGLVGGIASGKSVICHHFEKLGAKVINCDKLAHDVYVPGTDCYRQITEAFGGTILNDDKTINRKVLGPLVFGDPDKLNKLNEIVWPALMTRVQSIIAEVRKQDLETGKRSIVMLEAAVLLKAGWQKHLHEIWSLIIPPERAVKRLIKRDNLTEEQAKQRISAQPENSTIVAHSNVVISTQWSYEFSQQQADRAWNGLMEYLKQTYDS